eukprot:709679-Rhodomonas_salina.1
MVFQQLEEDDMPTSCTTIEELRIMLLQLVRVCVGWEDPGRAPGWDGGRWRALSGGCIALAAWSIATVAAEGCLRDDAGIFCAFVVLRRGVAEAVSARSCTSVAGCAEALLWTLMLSDTGYAGDSDADKKGEQVYAAFF